LPGGSRAALPQGLRKHLVPLPPETRIYAGHGPRTTIGHERETNPSLYTI
jgi:glyoxylase-like metal-dependent hydrolase (beta-lactamase superfamily II)